MPEIIFSVSPFGGTERILCRKMILYSLDHNPFTSFFTSHQTAAAINGGGQTIMGARTMTETDLAITRSKYSRLEALLGRDMALYCLCAVYDLPYDPESDAESWDEYLAGLPKEYEFADGETDANAALLAGMPTQERWATVWGDGYSETDYKQLDDLYRTMTAQLDSTGGLDPQQQDTARTCARMALNRNKLISNYKDKDAISTANTLDKMIRENLKDSNMRKADILPSAQQRLDGIVDALRKKHGLSMEMTQDEVFAAFHRWCEKKKYPFTIDAAEHMIMLIMNLIQKNDDLPEMYNAPDDMNFGPYAAEFEREPNEAENEAYEYLGLVRGEWEKGDK